MCYVCCVRVVCRVCCVRGAMHAVKLPTQGSTGGRGISCVLPKWMQRLSFRRLNVLGQPRGAYPRRLAAVVGCGWCIQSGATSTVFRRLLGCASCVLCVRCVFGVLCLLRSCLPMAARCQGVGCVLPKRMHRLFGRRFTVSVMVHQARRLSPFQ